jgi:DNA-binding transcriptional regulator WhiA
MNEKYAHLLGLLLSDGSVYYDKSKKTYCIQFTNKSERLRNLFKDLMRECFNVKSFYEISCKNAISIRVFSKRIAEILFRYSPTFRTLPCKSFPACNGFSCFFECKPIHYDGIEYPPSEIHESIISNPNHIKPFMRGFVSGDGGIYINKRHGIYTVEIACYHPFLKNQVIRCLESIGIQTRSKQKAVIVSGIKPFTKFMDEVGVIK